MFAALRRTSTPEVLDSSLVAIRKVCTKNSSAIDLPLYQAAKCFVEEILIEKDSTGDMNTIISAPLAGSDSVRTNQLDRQTVQRSDPISAETNQLEEQKFKRYLHELALAILPRTSDTDAESLRSASIHFGLTLSQSKVVGLETRETLNEMFTSWLEYERSRPLRLLIEQAFEANKNSRHG